MMPTMAITMATMAMVARVSVRGLMMQSVAKAPTIEEIINANANAEAEHFDGVFGMSDNGGSDGDACECSSTISRLSQLCETEPRRIAWTARRAPWCAVWQPPSRRPVAPHGIRMRCDAAPWAILCM